MCIKIFTQINYCGKKLCSIYNMDLKTQIPRQHKNMNIYVVCACNSTCKSQNYLVHTKSKKHCNYTNNNQLDDKDCINSFRIIHKNI